MDEAVDIEGLQQNIKELRQFVHGTETENVILGGIATPSLRHLVRSIEEGVHGIIARAETFESRLEKLEAKIEEMHKLYDGKGTYCGPVAVGSINDISKAGVVFVLENDAPSLNT